MDWSKIIACIFAWLTENLSDLIAIVISIAALIFSVKQFFYEKDRNRKEATIHAFDQIEGNSSVSLLFSLSKPDIDDLVKCANAHDKRIESKWNALNDALPLIEHFAVGINSKIYDLEILNRMAGSKVISSFHTCASLLEHKRNTQGKENNYSEFEKMVCDLILLRQKKNQFIPDCE